MFVPGPQWLEIILKAKELVMASDLPTRALLPEERAVVACAAIQILLSGLPQAFVAKLRAHPSRHTRSKRCEHILVICDVHASRCSTAAYVDVVDTEEGQNGS